MSTLVDGDAFDALAVPCDALSNVSPRAWFARVIVFQIACYRILFVYEVHEPQPLNWRHNEA